MNSNFRADEKPERVYSQYTQRRGVTLFIVLALMMMFLMLVMAFMVITTQYRKQAEHMAHALTEPPKTGDGGTVSANFDTALEKLLVGDKLESVIGPYSILENLYGHPESGNQPNLSGTIISSMAQTNNFLNIGIMTYSSWYPNSGNTTMEYLNLIGNVLTITEIPDSTDTAKKERLKKIKGKSTFIISFNQNVRTFFDTTNAISIAPFPDVTLQASDLIGCEFIINSPQFGGTGPGFDDSVQAGEAALKLEDGNDSLRAPFALRPNIFASTPNSYQSYLQNNLVLMNPDYTAPDYLNMFLAWNNVQYNTTSGTWVLGNPDNSSEPKIIPSFHRPQLVRYWGDITPMLLKTVLRPLPLPDLHPKFTGSNPAAKSTNLFNFLANGPWDVDNDGDGIADSIWIDAGLGTVTIGGKTYKKLVAYYVLDMDGRVNVNVHGNEKHVRSFGSGNFDSVTPEDNPLTEYGGLELRGSGSGPAEVRLDLAIGKIIGDDTNNLTNLTNILTGNTTTPPVDGRYGTDKLAGNNDAFPTATKDIVQWGKEQMGINLQAYAGYNNNNNPPSQRPYSGLGDTVPDWGGAFAMQFDPLGNRYWGQIFPQYSNLHLDTLHNNNPYLMNPYSSGSDRPFDSGDLQALIRNPGDIDFMSQSQRLRTLLELSSPYSSNPYRWFFATRSSDIPTASLFNRFCPATTGPPIASSVLAHGLYQYIYNYVFKYTDPNVTINMLYQLLPEEIRRGEKINLNRLTLLQDWQKNPTDGDLLNGVLTLQKKYKFAQEIFYFLLVLNYDQLYDQPDGNGTMTYSEGTLTREQVIARLAQWSINLVDFIDPDDVMTPLVYSTTPFETGVLQYFSEDVMNDPIGKINKNSWTPPNATYRIAWGMEKPEVAITETMAIHNRRVADSVKDNPSAGTCSKCNKSLARMNPDCDDADQHDQDFDQVMIPQGSLFVELYRQGNPNRAASSPAGNVLNYNNPDGAPYLNLASKTSASANDGSNVWRLVISEKNVSTPDFDWSTRASSRDNDALWQLKNSGICSFQTKQWPTPTSGTLVAGCFDNETNIVPERIIWFTPSAPVYQGQIVAPMSHDVAKTILDKHSYCCLSGSTTTALLPNSYLVIASRASINLLSQPVDGTNTQFGKFKSTDDMIAMSDNRIYPPIPKPNNPNDSDDPNYNRVKVPTVKYAATGHPNDPNYDINVSVSEPLRDNYYSPLPTYVNEPYSTALEHPFDTDELESYGTIPCYRTICLQRLADPGRQHHPMTNPYVTVDWNMIDLHVINSEKDSEGSEDPVLAADSTRKGDLYLNSRQWGTVGGGDTKNHPNLWARNFSGTDNPEVGYLDVGTAQTNGDVALNPDKMSLGWLNKYPGVEPIAYNDLTALDLPSVTTSVLIGAPDTAFLHLPWNNSPLTNTYELMLVPASTPDRFGAEFYDNETLNWVNTATTQSLGSGLRYSNPDSNGGLGMYLNFFSGDLHLSRLFEYVRVPSKFGGTIRDWTTIPYGGSKQLVKPIYEMREPGKINLNTATEPAWEALRGSTNRQNWNDYTNADDNGLYALRHKEAIDNNYPSEFIPFRSPQATMLVPPLKTSVEENNLVQNPANTTLLRSGLLEPETDAGNPYTALENYMRLSDMTTTRSNVFAVWMTIGYFEAEYIPGLNDPMIPDKYRLGAEKGLDNGTVKRHRAFYLIDRSTPVGFRRGEVFRQENGNPHYKPVIVNSKILE